MEITKKNGFVIATPLGAYLDDRLGPGVEAGWTPELNWAHVFGRRAAASEILMALPARLGCRLVEVSVERVVKKNIFWRP